LPHFLDKFLLPGLDIVANKKGCLGHDVQLGIDVKFANGVETQSNIAVATASTHCILIYFTEYYSFLICVGSIVCRTEIFVAGHYVNAQKSDSIRSRSDIGVRILFAGMAQLKTERADRRGAWQ
jgi:hypothetical protein